MEYNLRFIGGPLDGSKERCATGRYYQTRIARQLVQSGLLNMAVYAYESSTELPGCVERVYRFDGTFPTQDAIRLLADSNTLE